MERSGYDVVIVGGGTAGGACAGELREQNFTGTIAIFAGENYPPHTRPGLTKGVLRGEQEPKDVYMNDAEWYADHDIALHMGTRVDAIDVDAHTVSVNGSPIGYGTLVLATGAEPRRLPVPESIAERVHVLRSIDNCIEARAHLRDDTRWVVIGGGYIGAEFTASGLMRGSTIDLCMQENVLWEGMYGAQVGGYFQRQLEQRGARIHPAQEVAEIAAAGDDAAITVTTKSGLRLEADHVLLAIGVETSLDLARDAGLELDGSGVVCDEYLHTSAPDVYAIGDIAAYASVVHDKRMRIEHWDVARQHGLYAARRIAGTDSQPFAVVPYFFSGLGDWAFMRYVGPGGGDMLLRGAFQDDAFAAVYVRDDVLQACLCLNRDDDLEAARALLPQHPTLDRERLTNADVSLQDVVVGVVGVGSKQ